jgi:hypothetical protein
LELASTYGLVAFSRLFVLNAIHCSASLSIGFIAYRRKSKASVDGRRLKLVASPTILIDAISKGIIARLYARSRAAALNSAGGGGVRTHSTVVLRDYKLSIADL